MNLLTSIGFALFFMFEWLSRCVCVCVYVCVCVCVCVYVYTIHMLFRMIVGECFCCIVFMWANCFVMMEQIRTIMCWRKLDALTPVLWTEVAQWPGSAWLLKVYFYFFMHRLFFLFFFYRFMHCVYALVGRKTEQCCFHPHPHVTHSKI